MGGVDSGDLQFFQSEEAKDGGSEALRSDLRVAEIAGGEDMEKPLYVSFPDAEVATASQAPAKQIWTCIVCFIVFNLFEFQQQRMMKRSSRKIEQIPRFKETEIKENHWRQYREESFVCLLP